jgi:TonB family protein
MSKSTFTCALVLLFTHFLSAQPAPNKSEPLPVLTFADTPPEYVGGDVALYTYIYQRLRFPPNAEMKECTVYIGFVVNENGSISDIAIKKGFSSDYNEAAVRVIKGMPKWKPGKQDGVARKVAWVMPIRFKLD